MTDYYQKLKQLIEIRQSIKEVKVKQAEMKEEQAKEEQNLC